METEESEGFLDIQKIRLFYAMGVKPDINKLMHQIRLREALIDQMVGQLYPSIMQSEIDEIYSIINR